MDGHCQGLVVDSQNVDEVHELAAGNSDDDTVPADQTKPETLTDIIWPALLQNSIPWCTGMIS